MRKCSRKNLTTNRGGERFTGLLGELNSTPPGQETAGGDEGSLVMKTIIVPIITAAAMAAAAPTFTQAQPGYGDRFDRYQGGYDQRWPAINARQQRLDRRIEAAMRNGRISPREAQSLRREFMAIARLEDRYRSSAPGLTQRERDDLNRRFDRLSSRIQVEQRDGNRYGYGYGPVY
jgi:hypothetical protein